MTVQSSHPDRLSWPLRLASAVLGLPRLLRIGLSALFAVAVVLLVHPLVDVWYYNHVYDFMLDNLPAYIARSGSTYILTTIGLLLYLLGWRLIVGMRGAKLRPRLTVVLYVAGGIAVIGANIALILIGLNMVD